MTSYINGPLPPESLVGALHDREPDTAGDTTPRNTTPGALTPGERDLVLADLGELLELLGLGDYARPQTPHEVFQMCLSRLREQSHAAYRNPDGSYHTSPPMAGRDADGGVR